MFVARLIGAAAAIKVIGVGGEEYGSDLECKHRCEQGSPPGEDDATVQLPSYINVTLADGVQHHTYTQMTQKASPACISRTATRQILAY